MMLKKELLLEGAVAGHMNHIYDNGEMTFGELKQLLQAISDGKVKGTEKTDGQNIFLSYDVSSGEAKAIRNKGHIKAGGLNVEEFDDFFSEHPSQALRYSFVEALKTFEEAIKNLSEEQQEEIFGPSGDIYFNTEVMNPGNPSASESDPSRGGTTNVIPYDKKTLLIHRVGHGHFDRETGNKLDQDITPNFDSLERALVNSRTDDPSVFSVETNQIRRLKPIENSEVIQQTLSKVDDLIRDLNLDDSATINDYVIVQVVPTIEQFGLTEDRNKMILKRVMQLPGKPTLTQITKGLPIELKDDISSFVKNFKYSSYTSTLQNVLHDFSVEAVNGLESAFIQDNQKQIEFLQNELRDTISRINSSSNERAKEELKRQMIKLKTFKGINTPSEGFVFDWNGVTYKLTGNFAPANQILGMERFQRFGPIEPAEVEPDADSSADAAGLTIAVVPGAFKPPHKGHLSMVEDLAKNADKVLIIVSSPTRGSRTLPSGKVIDSDHALQIWNSFLDNSPAGKKTTVIKSPAASPVGVTYDFVMKDPAPMDMLIAPRGATVLLGCGDKEDDKSRYDSIVNKAREDLTIKVQVCSLTAKHSSEYLQTLKEHPAFLEGMPSNKKATVSIEDLHASDMRYVIDLAAADPVGAKLLSDFVPLEEDVPSLLGILGINPPDQGTEDDQVSEPEIDDDKLMELIIREVLQFTKENIHPAQRAPTGNKSKDEFQISMKKRLSRAHAFYLDQGRHDLTKYGGGFHLPRPKDISNAFLAELRKGKQLKQILNRRTNKMNRNEAILRREIRKKLKKFFALTNSKESQHIKDIMSEHRLRNKIRNLIIEAASEDPTADVHDNTGINTLKDLLKSSNVLSTLRNVYKTLTTDEDQKRSFRAHIVKWIQDTLAPVRLNDTKEEPSGSMELAEEVGIDVQGIGPETTGTDTGKLIDADDGSPKSEEPEQEENTMEPISGEDTTGRNKAERVYPTIEKSIIDYYAELDNPEDQEMFYDYLIANIKLYFDKWDGEMSKAIKEPTNDEYEKAKEAI